MSNDANDYPAVQHDESPHPSSIYEWVRHRIARMTLHELNAWDEQLQQELRRIQELQRRQQHEQLQEQVEEKKEE